LASSEAYAVACIELYSRLWLELEALAVPRPPAPDSAQQRAVALHGQALRLELALLIEACGSRRWQALLDPLQRLGLQAMLEATLAALSDLGDGGHGAAIERAQNQLLDAVLLQCSWSSSVRASWPLRNAAS
jgi:hypothetical protein